MHPEELLVNEMLKTICCAAMLALALPGAVFADNKDVIDYREHIMNTLNEQAAAAGMILSGAVPDDNLTAHLEAIALSARIALKAFQAKVPGGEAKPEVWANWADFSKRMTEFAQKTDELAKMAKTGNKDAVFSNVVDALSCKSCHDTYRNEKK
jgi:cytochrome c556